MPYVVMEDLLDKLKLLNYEEEFVKDLRMRPLNRHYFVIQTNPGEQFYLFTSLAAWLIRKTGRNFEPPQEFDDPNTVITNILENVRQMGVSIGNTFTSFWDSNLPSSQATARFWVRIRTADSKKFLFFYFAFRFRTVQAETRIWRTSHFRSGSTF